jgi:hypothetical protein
LRHNFRPLSTGSIVSGPVVGKNILTERHSRAKLLTSLQLRRRRAGVGVWGGVRERSRDKICHSRHILHDLPPPVRSHLLKAHSAMNSSLDQSIFDEVSALMIQSLLNNTISWAPNLHHMSLWGTFQIQTITDAYMMGSQP